MARATRVSTPPPDTSATDLESFAALAAAVHPAWHQAVIRLAKSTDDLSAKMSLLLNEPGSVRENAGKVVEMLIAYIDLIAGNFDHESDLGWTEQCGRPVASFTTGPANQGERDDCEDEDGPDDEPSLGSSGHYDGGSIIYLAHAISDGFKMVYDCEGDEHDGREPDCEDEGAQCDDEGVVTL